jgi:hypothetical protein
MKRVTPLIAALLSLLALWPVVAQGTGVLTGTVINLTEGGGPVDGLEVTLHAFTQDREGQTQVTTTDADGRFEFTELGTGSEWSYRLRVPYQDVSYSSGPLAFEPGKEELPARIAVYETTTDDAQIVVNQAHIWVQVSKQGGDTAPHRTQCAITEMYLFENRGDRTYVGQASVEDRLYTSAHVLPAQAAHLTFDDGALGGRFLLTEDGFVDTEPQWPGTTRIMYGYILEGDEKGCDLSRRILHPIADLNVPVPDSGIEVESSLLAQDGTITARDGQTYLRYAAQDLAPGQRLDLVIRAAGVQPEPATASKAPHENVFWMVVGSIALVAALAYPFWQQRARRARAQEPSEPAPADED